MQILALLFVPILFAQPDPAVRKCVVEGVVVQENTGEAMRQVEIGLVPMHDRKPGQPAPPAIGVYSDSNGHFRIPELEPGVYRVRLRKDGFSPALPSGSIVLPKLEPGQELVDFKFTMAPQAVLSGRVLDENGDPVSNASVLVFRAKAVRGRQAYQMGSVATTDDRGIFHVAGIDPGRYILAADEMELRDVVFPSGGVLTAYVTTYYPSVSDQAQAQPLEVSRGTVQTGLEIRLKRETVFAVRGRALDANGQSLQRFTVNATRLGAGPAVYRGSLPNFFTDGAFVLPGLRAGTWILRAVPNGTNALSSAEIQVGGGPVDGVILRPVPKQQIGGTLILEEAGAATPDWTQVGISIQAVEGLFGAAAPSPDATGQFTLTFQGTGKVWLNVVGVPAPGTFLAKVLLGAQDVTGKELDAAEGGNPPLKLVFRPGAATLTGRADNADPNVLGARPTISLWPADPLQRDARAAQSGAFQPDGTFSIADVRPGEYLVYVGYGFEGGPYGPADPPEDLEARSTRVRPGARRRTFSRLETAAPPECPMRSLLLLAVALSAAAQTGPCTVEGTVFQDGNGAPVARARVLFRKFGGTFAPALGYFTDDNGRFRAEGLENESYSVSVNKVGFLPPLSTRRQQSAARVNLSRSCQQAELQYLLIPTAILSGRLTDTNGQPASRAGVEAQRRAWLNGRWQFRTIASATANSQGEFRISRLPAGQYVLRTRPSGPITVSFRDASGPTHYVAPAYFPGVYEVEKAQMITVDTGIELGGFDFGPTLVPFFTVSGRVLDSEGQGAPSHCQVLLRPANGAGEERVARYTAQTGEFEFPDVAPGKYQLLAYAAGTTTIGTVSRELEISEHDATGLQLQLEPPFSVQGRATLQGGALPLDSVFVSLLPTTPKAAAATPGRIEEDGAFSIPLVGHDLYRIVVTTSQPNIYLRSVSADGKPQPGHWLDWRFGGPRQIGLHLANDGGRLEGTISGVSGPGENAYVVLVPADMERLAGSSLIVGQVGMVGRGGPLASRFRIASIPPGDYLAYTFAIALGDGVNDPAMLADPAWVPTYKGPGTPVRIEPNALAQASLTLLPLP